MSGFWDLSDCRIVVDVRERSSGVPEALLELGIDLSYRSLSVGDYHVGESLVFERKTLPDLAVSIQDGRLFRQARRLSQLNTFSALILEGAAGSLGSSRMTRQSIQGALISLSLVFGIPVLRARSAGESAHLMIYAWRQLGPLRRRSHRYPAGRSGGKKKAQLHLLQGFPGVVPVRAQSLLEAFGSVEAIARASAQELCSVKGVGLKTACLVRWLFEP